MTNGAAPCPLLRAVVVNKQRRLPALGVLLPVQPTMVWSIVVGQGQFNDFSGQVERMIVEEIHVDHLLSEGLDQNLVSEFGG